MRELKLTLYSGCRHVRGRFPCSYFCLWYHHPKAALQFVSRSPLTFIDPFHGVIINLEPVSGSGT